MIQNFPIRRITAEGGCVGRLRGVVAEIEAEDVLIDVMGVGYIVRCGARTLARLPSPVLKVLAPSLSIWKIRKRQTTAEHDCVSATGALSNWSMSPGAFYSARSASTGFTDAARRAGI